MYTPSIVLAHIGILHAGPPFTNPSIMPKTCFTNEFEEAMGLFSQRHSMASLKVADPLSAFSQHFTLVSCEGEHIAMPIYDLMSWSKFFRDLLQTGRGEKRVELEERAETIEQFKELVYAKRVTWREFSAVPFFEQVFALTAFLDKYDCPRALKDLVEILARGASGPSITSTVSGGTSTSPELPPLVLFAVGARLAQPEVCEAALDLPKGSWAHYKPWTHPPGIGDKYRNTLHPLGIPYSLLEQLPYEYTLALALTPVKENIKPGYDKDRARNGREFAEQLNKIGKLKKVVEGKKDRA